MAICSPVCSPVRPCSPVLDYLNSNVPRPNQRPPAGQPLQGRSTPSTSPARPWLGAAACLGPKTGTPLGGLRNSPKGRLELPARETGREYLLRGGHLGAGAFSVVDWLFTIHHSPFTVYFHHPLARSRACMTRPASPSRSTFCRVGNPCPRSAGCAAARPQGCNLCYAKHPGTGSGKNCFFTAIGHF